jgi:hypothetical protein
VAVLADLIDPAYLEGLETWPLADVRAHKDEATEVETGLSYLRRLVQGNLDILRAEQHRREEGLDPGDLAAIVDALPSILSDRVHGPGLGRLPALMAPGALDRELVERLEAILPTNEVGHIIDMSDGGLAETTSKLEELERTISSQRQAVFGVVDRLEAEIVRRYQSGEATVDSLLQ